MELEKTKPRLRNANVAVRESEGEIVFLHQIVPGGADQSYGIHVARLAGVPAPVLERAREILKFLEKQHGPDPGLPEGPIRRKVKTGRALAGQPLRRAARIPSWSSSDRSIPTSLTPEQALDLVKRLARAGGLNHSALSWQPAAHSRRMNCSCCTFAPMNCSGCVIATPFDHSPCFRPKTYSRLPCMT